MIETRETRTKKKRTWVQVTPAVASLEPEPERVVGRDLSENIKSTTGASSVQKTKISAESAQNTNTGNAKDTAPEPADRLTALQGILESGQRETNARIDKIFCYLTRESKDKDAVIARLKGIEENYHKLQEEEQKKEKDYLRLLDKKHIYKSISIVSTVLFFMATAISILTT